MNGRVYDPMLGRFLSPDNIVQAPGNSQSYNRYSYCLNNPFAYTDPSGYSVLSNFGDWVNKSFDKLGDWLNKNDITIGFGYNTTLSNPGGGTPYAGASVDGTNISVGYNLDSGQVGIGTNNGGAITNFSYLSDNTGQSVQTAVNNIEIVRAVYFDEKMYEASVQAQTNAKFDKIMAQSAGGSTSLIAIGPEHTDAFDGFWGKARYFFFGPNDGNARYDMNGNYQGPALITGIAPTPGFKGGSVFIKGLGSVEKELFHLSIKPDILQAAGNFSKVVGRNPDIAVKEGLIILKGTGPYSGKVFQTGLNALDYFGF